MICYVFHLFVVLSIVGILSFCVILIISLVLTSISGLGLLMSDMLCKNIPDVSYFSLLLFEKNVKFEFSDIST